METVVGFSMGLGVVMVLLLSQCNLLVALASCIAPGLGMSILQLRVLRRHIGRPRWWVWTTTGGWLLATILGAGLPILIISVVFAIIWKLDVTILGILDIFLESPDYAQVVVIAGGLFGAIVGF